LTERTYSAPFDEWIGRVVNVFDSDQDGRVQVRIYGHHDDSTNIPDSDLLWAKPHQDITSAAQNKMGGTPVGVIVGSIIRGYFLDKDKQTPIFTGTIAKAGDPQSSNILDNAIMSLIPGTNSSPLGSRIASNAFITRKGKNIMNDDSGSSTPQEQKDSDGVDIVGQAKSATKFATYPTVGSITNPLGSILTQIQSNDPQNLNGVLKQAVAAYIKIKDLNSVSSAGGVNNLLGQALGSAMSSLGPSITSAIQSLTNSGGLSSIAQQALSIASQFVSSGASLSNTLSAAMQGVVNQSLGSLTSQLTQLASSGQLNVNTLNALLNSIFSELQNNGSQSIIGTNQNNILNELESVIPQIAPLIQSTLTGHLPASVLNNSIITKALQAFSMNQGFLKFASDGKKALAMLAVGSTPPPASTSNPTSNVPVNS